MCRFFDKKLFHNIVSEIVNNKLTIFPLIYFFCCILFVHFENNSRFACTVFQKVKDLLFSSDKFDTKRYLQSKWRKFWRSPRLRVPRGNKSIQRATNVTVTNRGVQNEYQTILQNWQVLAAMVQCWLVDGICQWLSE